MFAQLRHQPQQEEKDYGAETETSGPGSSGSSVGALQLIQRGSDLRWAWVVLGPALAVMVFWRIYQQLFAWKYGLDAKSSGFRDWWTTLLLANLIGIGLVGSVMMFRISRGCRECAAQRAAHGDVSPEHEVQHIWRLWALIAGFTVMFLGFAYFAEEDASWHAITIRDTAFTVTHIPLFYGAAPMTIMMAGAIYLYGATRLPKIYAKGVPLSLALLVAGTFMLFTWVAFNEWGHSFWIAEERFSAPLHWGFVLFGVMAFALVSVFIQTVERVVAIGVGEAEREAGGGSELAAPALQTVAPVVQR